MRESETSEGGLGRINVEELTRGLANPLSNKFTVAFKGERTRPLDVTASSNEVETALVNDISHFDDIEVSTSSIGVGGDREWIITFKSPSAVDALLERLTWLTLKVPRNELT